MRERVIITAADTDPSLVALKEQYFGLRARAYQKHWGEGLYPNGPDARDLLPDTTYVLQVEGGKVIAGLRLLMHAPGSETKLPIEANHPAFDMQKALLPHIDVKNLSYSELGGLAADTDEKYRKRHLGSSIVAEALNFVREGAIKNNGTPLDVVVACASKLGLPPIVRGAQQSGTKGVVRDDLAMPEEDKRFDTTLWPILLSPNSDFPFQSPQMKAKGLGTSIDAFVLPERSHSQSSASMGR